LPFSLPFLPSFALDPRIGAVILWNRATYDFFASRRLPHSLPENLCIRIVDIQGKTREVFGEARFARAKGCHHLQGWREAS